MTTQRQALEAALSALESERIMAKDGQSNYTVEVTPKRILDAIVKVKEALVEPKPITEPVRTIGGIVPLSDVEFLEFFEKLSPLDQALLACAVMKAFKLKEER